MKFYRIPNVECVRKDNTCITLTIDSHAIRFLLESTPPHFHVCGSFVFFFGNTVSSSILESMEFNDKNSMAYKIW